MAIIQCLLVGRVNIQNDEKTDRQTDRQTDILLSSSANILGGAINTKKDVQMQKTTAYDS